MVFAKRKTLELTAVVFDSYSIASFMFLCSYFVEIYLTEQAAFGIQLAISFHDIEI